MILTIPDVLTPEELDKLTSALAQGEYIDGKLTAGWHGKLVKNNQQLKSGTVTNQKLQKLVITALQSNPLFEIAIRPRHIHSLLFSRYEVGMSYGRHTDNALMGSNYLRSDVSFTLFLNSPDDYEGGELTVEFADSEKSYKLKSGSAIAYPSTTLHHIEPIRQGTRLVAVGWVQSLIRDANKREILFELETTRRTMFAKSGKTAEFDLLSKSISNLLRMWVD
jgi:PKHD-type hydroxylase